MDRGWERRISRGGDPVRSWSAAERIGHFLSDSPTRDPAGRSTRTLTGPVSTHFTRHPIQRVGGSPLTGR